MIEELYFYANPKLTAENKSPFNLFHVLCVALFSLLIAFSNIPLGILVTTLYLGVSLLTFLDKDQKSRGLTLGMLACVNISVVGIYIFGKVYANNLQTIIGSVLFGFIFFAIYEIVVFTRIKKRYYSSSVVPNIATTATISSFTILLSVFVFKCFSRIQGIQFWIVITLMLLCAAIVLFAMILLQKLIIYKLTKNKIQANFDDR